MKKVIFAIWVILAALSASAQSYNPFLGAGIVSPAPMLPVEFNGTGAISFNVGNSGSSAMPLVVGDEMRVTVTLSKGVPDNADPIAAIGGTAKALFDWSYNSGIRTYTGVQNQTIPATYTGSITIAYEVAENSASPGNNGFNANIQPPAYTGGQVTTDDAVSSYTYTRAYDYGDAPSIYGVANHEIYVLLTGGVYTKYVYMGSAVDPESANQASAFADGDDSNGIDDEDGVTYPPMIKGTNVTIPVVVTWQGVVTYAFLFAWIDWNADGDFNDANEQIANGVFVNSSTTINLSVSVPSSAVAGATFARFRIGDYVNSPSGFNPFGEVEDYQINVVDPLAVSETHGDVVCPGDDDGSIDLTVTGGLQPYSYAWTASNGGVIPSGQEDDEDLTGLVTGTYSVVVTDANLSTAGLSVTIVSTDTEKPVISTTAVSGNLGCNPTVTAPVFTGLDNCDGVFTPSVTITGPSNTGCAYTQTWTANYTDASNNVATPVSITYTWTVDTEAPVIATTAVSGNLGCNPTVVAPVFTVTDNCDDPATLTASTTGPSNTGCDYTQTWTADYTDACGNPATQASITYTWTEDTQVPTAATCPEDIDINIDPEEESIVVNYTVPTFNDNCEGTGLVGTLVEGLASGSEFPLGATVVTYTYTDGCNNTGTCSFTVTITNEPPSTYAVSGNLYYYNINSDISMSGVPIELQIGGTPIYNTTTGAGGAYSFPAVAPAVYDIVVTKTAPWGNINSTDAAQVNYWSAIPGEIEKVRFFAGDVAGNGTPGSQNNKLTAYDAQRIQGYFVSGGALTLDRERWSFWPAGDKISANPIPGWPSGTLYYSLNVDSDKTGLKIYGLVTGDFNRYYVPGAKDQPSNVGMVYGEPLLRSANTEFDLPVSVTAPMTVSAVSLILNFPADLVEVTDVTMDNAGGMLDWAVNGNELRIGWNTLAPIGLKESETLLTLKLRSSSGFISGKTIRFEVVDDPLNELADGSFKPIPGAIIRTSTIESSTTAVPDQPGTENMMLSNFPNPFSDKTTITYNLPVKGHVSLYLTDMLGRNGGYLVDTRQDAGKYSLILDSSKLFSGVYTLTLKLDTGDETLVRTIKMVVNRNF